MKALLVVGLVSVLVGCATAPSPQADAASRVRPVIAALKAYHHDRRDYPQQLDELRPHYLRADVPFYDNTNVKHIWRCLYNRVDQNNYSLGFYSNPCSEAMFDKNGKFIAGYGPNWR
ncbi:MAG: hypothetical protein ACREIC_20420 [Limisphaerales bacterium]